MNNSSQPNHLGAVELKRYREARVNEHVAEIRRAVHDGEWSVALQEATELCDRLVPLAASAERDGEQS